MEQVRNKKLEYQKTYDKRTNYAAQKKYRKNNTRSVTVAFYLNTEMDILNKLDSVSNKSGYIKQLIRDDIARHGEY